MTSAPDTEGDDLLDIAWADHLAWGAAARRSRRESQREARIWLTLLCLSSAFAAVAPFVWSYWIVQGASVLIAMLVIPAAGLTRSIVDDTVRGDWVAAQVRADAIRSECYRYAARIGEFAGRDAALRFKDRLDAIGSSLPAEGIFPAPPDAAIRGRAPPAPMSGMWYCEQRLAPAQDWHRVRAKHSAARRRLPFNVAVGVAAVAGLLVMLAAVGVVAAGATAFAATAATVIAGVVAYEALYRPARRWPRDGAMATQIESLRRLYGDGRISDEELISFGEKLLASEYGARTDWITLKVMQGDVAAGRRGKRSARR